MSSSVGLPVAGVTRNVPPVHTICCQLDCKLLSSQTFNYTQKAATVKEDNCFHVISTGLSVQMLSPCRSGCLCGAMQALMTSSLCPWLSLLKNKTKQKPFIFVIEQSMLGNKMFFSYY
jgi:hypothetical protein